MERTHVIGEKPLIQRLKMEDNVPLPNYNILYDGTKVFENKCTKYTEWVKERCKCCIVYFWVPVYTSFCSASCGWGLGTVSNAACTGPVLGACSGLLLGTMCCSSLAVGSMILRFLSLSDNSNQYSPGSFRECSCTCSKFALWPSIQDWQPLTKKNIRRLLKQVDNDQANALFKQKYWQERIAKRLIRKLNSEIRNQDLIALIMSYVLQEKVKVSDIAKSLLSDNLTTFEKKVNKKTAQNLLFLDREYLHSLLKIEKELPQNEITQFYSSILWLERCGWISLKTNKKYCVRVQPKYFDGEQIKKEMNETIATKYSALKSGLNVYVQLSKQLVRVYQFEQDPYYACAVENDRSIQQLLIERQKFILPDPLKMKEEGIDDAHSNI